MGQIDALGSNPLYVAPVFKPGLAKGAPPWNLSRLLKALTSDAWDLDPTPGHRPILKSLFLSLSFFFLLSSFFLSGQTLKHIRSTQDTVRIDSLSLIPNSWRILSQNGVPVADSLYRIDWVNGLLIWSGKIRPGGDSIRVEYERYPIRLNKIYQHKDLNYNRIDRPLYGPPFMADRESSGDRLSSGSLRSSGSLSRGISAGSQRDASLTSNLNLQIEGSLNRDFRIEATLTDANIPVQPDGNTQQIQEFDRVYLRIYNPKNEILGGDFDIQQTGGYFLRMNKRVQGVRFTTETGGKNGRPVFRTSTGAAVVKGKYSRNPIQGQEGNQGPYQLTGAGGENYLQVIAGSEKVYIDGHLLMRGEEADYVMDYNTAEIRFTPKNLITKDKRIVIEFEYTERSYARFLLFNENRWTTKTGSWYVSLFSENDARNQPLLQDLTDAGRATLSGIGDRSDRAIMPTIRESPFLTDRVLYKLADTLVDGIRYDSILIQSFHPDSARYEAGFSFTGAGNGHYRPVQSAANGRVFEWVAPAGGVLQGSYEPVTRLVMPQSKQVLVTGMRQKLGSRMEMGLEWALSRNDRNTFSTLDDHDNFGIGIRTDITRRDYLKPDSSLFLESFVNYRFAGSRFDPAERFREVEFERDWNLPANQIQQENLFESGVQLSGRDSLAASYRFQYLGRPGTYSGFRQFSHGRILKKKWETGWNGSYLLTSGSDRDTRFLRHNAYYRQRLGRVRLEFSENAEDNRWLAPAADTLLSGSMGFQEFRFEALEQRDSRQPWLVRISERTDLQPAAGRLKPAGRAIEAETWFDIARNPAAPLKAGIHFRTLSSDSSRTTAENNGESVTARLDSRWKAFKGLLQSQTFLELGSGSDRKPEYSYLEVPAGQGHYTWNDYNSNGIKELDEFETAYFRDQAAYIRVYRLGTERIPTFVTRFNQTFTIQPKKGFLQKFSSQLAYRIDQKINRDSIRLLYGRTSESSLLSLNSQLRHTLSFNRGNPKFSLELVTQKQATRTTLINGAEEKNNYSNSLLLRYRINPSWQLNSNSEMSNRKSVSEFFPARNFELASLSQLLQIECETGKRLRISLDAELRSEKNNTDGSSLLSNRAETTLTTEIPDKGQISLSLQYVFIRFTGSPGSPSGYTMLRGLQNGHNGVVQLSARYKIAKNLVLEGMYEGRITGNGKPVHNAQLQVRALF